LRFIAIIAIFNKDALPFRPRKVESIKEVAIISISP